MLPSSTSRRITVDSERFRFAVTEMDASNENIVPIVVTVQHEVANGAMLRITGLTITRVPISESKWYDGRTVATPVTPHQIAELVVRAIQSGWMPKNPGPPFILQVKDTQASSA